MLRFVCLVLVLPGCIPEGSGQDGDPDAGAACVPGRAEACACEDGRSGSQSCGDDGRFGACRCAPSAGDDGGVGDAARPPVDAAIPPDAQSGADGGAACPAGSTETRPCGVTGGGMATRACAGGVWGPWSDCAGGDCVDGAVETESCGQGGEGRRSRTCDAGLWSSFGDCEGAPVCADGVREFEPCGATGEGTRGRTCAAGAWGAWGACDDPTVACEPSAIEEAPCGLNRRGFQARTCGDDGVWGRFGDCDDPDACVDDHAARRDCGLNGGGAERRTCVEGAWSAWSACADPDVCVVGAEQVEGCGAGDRGARRRVCLAGQWAQWSACEGGEPECAGGAVETEACGRDDRGERTRRCQDGLWTPFGPCAGGCPDRESPDCSPPRAEVCNGIDDDQDGTADEGLVLDGPDDDPLTPFEQAVVGAIARGVDHLRALEDGRGRIVGGNARHNFLAVLVMLGQRSLGPRGQVLGFEGLPPADQAMVQRLLAQAIADDPAAASAEGTPYTYASGGNLAALTAYLATGGPDDVGAAVGAAAAAANLTANLLETQGALAPGNLGGWNYNIPGARGDLSTTHYGAMGLASVDGTEAALRDMQPFLTSVIQPDGGMGYNASSDSSSSMTAVGLWLLRLSGLPADDARVVGALDWLAEHYLYDDMVGGFRPASTYIYLWYLTKALAVSVAPNDPRFAVRRPADLGYPESPAGHYFDVAYTLLSWQDAEGAWGTGEAGSPSPGWTRESSHAFALLTLMQALVELGPAGVGPGGLRPACADGVDNDSDGRVDGDDPDCLLPCGVTERPRPVCSNGLDDDGDGFVDHPADPGCLEADGAAEDAGACDNGADDDGDGRVDWPADPGCATARDRDETDDGETACANGRDDDGDGAIDWPDDVECASAASEREDAVCPGVEARVGPGQYVVRGTLEGAADQLDWDCGAEGGAERVYPIFVDGPASIFARRAGDDGENPPALGLQVGCDFDASVPVASCSPPGGGAPSLRLEAPGTVLLLVGGAGAFEIHLDIRPHRATCANGLDDDQDGWLDWPHDPGCASAEGPTEVDPDVPPACANDADDDRDGWIDWPVDPGCSGAGDDDERDPAAPPGCSNAEDDDGDGRVDYPADPGCDGAGDDSEEDGTLRACSNGVDDDADGRIDWPDDPQCVAAADGAEGGGAVPVRCRDGVDNDLDGRVDLADPGCVDARDDDERDPAAPPTCANAVDDDADGQIDWPEDEGCAAAGDACEQAGYGVCDGACVDVSTNAARCGACDVVCDDGVECIDGICGGLYRFEGVRSDVPDADLVGWRPCHTDLYSGSGTRVDALVAGCDGDYVMLGCRPVGSATWNLLAMGEWAEVFTDTGSGQQNARTAHAHNGVEWYFSDQWSIGFAPGGEVVNRNTCDVEQGRGDERMCWHTSRETLSAGYRCGTWTGAGGQQRFERAVWTYP